jgi:hypothetical protein
MKLKVGYKSVPIDFDNGQKESVFFNPADPALMTRLKEFYTSMGDYAQKIDDIQLDENGQPTEMDAYEKFEELQGVLFAEMDKAFGSNVSSTIFKYCSPFAMVDGKFFIEQFLEAIIPEIEKHIKKANTEVEKRMSKHIGKYQK